MANNGNRTGTDTQGNVIVMVREVWQTTAEPHKRAEGDCMRGILVFYGQRPACTGVNCRHTSDY